MNSIQEEDDIYDNVLLRLLAAPRTRVLRYLLLAVIILFLIGGKEKPEFSEPVNTYISFFALLLTLLVLCTNMYLLVPHFLFKSKYISYFVAVLLLGGLSMLILAGADPLVKPYRLEPKRRENFNLLRFMTGYTFFFCIFVAASTAIKLFQRWVKDNYRINKLEKYRMQSELDQLKSQINPHFLFNTLNNAHVLTKKDPEKASQVLLRLSDLLRYQIYDSARSNVLLDADIHFINDFLALEKMRRDQFSFTVLANGYTHNILIPPFLFISFVENAVKHSMDANKASYVHIGFDVDDNQLRFHCTNSKPGIASGFTDKTGGLGMRNVQRRLALLYPDTHRLAITDTTDTYTVQLIISL